MQTGSRTGIQYLSADGSDNPIAVVTASDSVGAWVDQYGLIVLPAAVYASIPAAGTYGRVFHPTDVGRENEFYFDTGSVWRLMSPPAPPGTIWYPHSTSANDFSNGAHEGAPTPTASPAVVGGGTILAANQNASPFISADGGVTWTQTGSYPAGVTGYGGYSYGLSLFVGCQRGTSYGNVVTNPGTTSTVWTARAMPATQRWMCTAFNGATFVAVGQSSTGAATTQAASSVNGTTWTSRTMATSATWDSVCWDGTKFVALPANSAACNVSADGITWNATNVGTMPASPLGNLASDGAGTCVVGHSSGYMYSVDHGATWTSRLITSTIDGYHCYYANGYWFFIDYSSTNTVTMMHVCATADLGKAPPPTIAAQPSYSAGLIQGTAWVVHTGTYTLAGTRSGVLRA